MSEKARDDQGRWRSKTIAFRISPEENDLLEQFVRLSGVTKQEYIIRHVLQQQVAVIPNTRVHKALREKMEQLCKEFQRVGNAGDVSPEVLSVLQMTSKIYDGLKKEEEHNG